jgi:uncharacterized protein (TIGR03790 family)
LALAIAWALQVMAPAAAALEPNEVAVVANANAAGSEALGKYYCLARGINQERLLVVKTTTEPIISRGEYNAALRDPVRKYLREHDGQDQVKCLALMWGVPVRVLGRELLPMHQRVQQTYKAMVERLEGRLTIDLVFLRTVNVAFPQPRTEGLTPLADLFEARTMPTKSEPGSFPTMLEAFAKEVNPKEAAAARLPDPQRRHIARRQLAALRLDVFGASRLPGCLPHETIAGVPDKEALDRLAQQAKEKLDQLKGQPETVQSVNETFEALIQQGGVAAAHEHCQRRLKALDTADEDAAVDSELALVWEGDDQLAKDRPNPMYWRLGGASSRPADIPARALMTARVDGPSARDALRIIKDSLQAEKDGLRGVFYIDAGGKFPQYDGHLTLLAQYVRKNTRFPVVLDTQLSLFPAGSCPDAALYVGWYSLQKYVPAFRWVRGSVGWHVASFEAQHLRDPASQEWCVKMIQNGVAATVGAVEEPTLGAFPLPQDFFPLLLTGRYTLAECYWRTVPQASWRLTLIADPLYNPFAKNPQLPLSALPPMLAGRGGTAPTSSP